MKSLWFMLLTMPVLTGIWEYEDLSGIPATPSPGATVMMMAAVLSLSGYRWYKYQRRRRKTRANLVRCLNCGANPSIHGTTVETA
jgi:hypothetical protein